MSYDFSKMVNGHLKNFYIIFSTEIIHTDSREGIQGQICDLFYSTTPCIRSSVLTRITSETHVLNALLCIYIINLNTRQKKDVKLSRDDVSVSLRSSGVTFVQRMSHLTHHQGAVLRSVSVRVAMGVVVASHHAEGLVGTLTCRRPERHK